MKIIKAFWFLITEWLAQIFLPFFLTWVAAVLVYLLLLLPISGILWLVGVENWEILMDFFTHNKINYAIWILTGFYVFYEMQIKSGELESTFIKFKHRLRD